MPLSLQDRCDEQIFDKEEFQPSTLSQCYETIKIVEMLSYFLQ